ncbi:proline--tRNA ligase [Paenibacillus sp. GP183]|uniref:proline--tRNA ligase n=1 Tax=Paenibacillus sp. GP183 TaxID=1882751 RepID=UPI00089C9E15|nr:proline--tRNA ligase [Paenibacillus sp. GP183]SEB82688.1 prolyl-tRNA synthetase [Paenibacillus sp. GP183]
MRQSTLLLTTLRESPSEAEAISHQLMLRAGYIRKLAAGIYTYLPLGRRVLRKVEQIVREEMDRADAQEVLMPAMQPAELWNESGRYSVYGPELIRLRDRNEREFALGPTHEEVVTALVRNEVNSYRKLPLTLYQIQTKFRDERRPRFGLLRGREFLMKDAYSFDKDWEGLDHSYWKMFDAYNRIFGRCTLDYRAVEADAGSIGSEGGTHEFMALAGIGEDTVVTCMRCKYAANLEKAESSFRTMEPAASMSAEIEMFHTPDLRTIDQLVKSLEIESADIINTLVYLVDGKAVAVLVRGDHEVNETKVKNYLGADNIELADSQMVKSLMGMPIGFIGPIGLNLQILVDKTVANMNDGIAGANKQDYHFRHVRPERDFKMDHAGDFRNVTEGETCPRCHEGILKFYRGIEIGHVFKLGTKYSKKLSATFLDSSGKEQVMIMGCYGIGLSRILSAVIEQNHDEQGIIWPYSLAPFHVHIIPISVVDEYQMKAAEELRTHLIAQGIEVLIDDRDERPGVKFKDSDLIGIPFRIVIGKDAVQGKVEFIERRNKEKQLVSYEEAASCILDFIKNIKA